MTPQIALIIPPKVPPRHDHVHISIKDTSMKHENDSPCHKISCKIVNSNMDVQVSGSPHKFSKKRLKAWECSRNFHMARQEEVHVSETSPCVPWRMWPVPWNAWTTLRSVNCLGKHEDAQNSDWRTCHAWTLFAPTEGLYIIKYYITD